MPSMASGSCKTRPRVQRCKRRSSRVERSSRSMPSPSSSTQEAVMSSNSSSSIESVLTENRSFPPPKEFSAGSRVGSMAEYEKLYRKADEDPEGFWAEIAGELDWSKKWTRTLEWKQPDAKWFVGGELNASASCLDRHVATWRKNKAALLWE